jgi:integrase
MATIRKRTTKDGKTRYQAIIRLQEGSDSKAFSNKTAAKKWAAKVENEIRLGTYIKQQESSKHTVGELIDRYLKDPHFLSKKDRRSRERHLKFWKDRIGDKRLSDVSRALIIEVRDELAAGKTPKGNVRAPATVNRFLAAISHCFSKGVEWEWLDANPCKGVSRMTEPKGRTRFLSDAERESLLKAAKEIDPTLHTIIVLALSTGARRGEIMDLEWSDIHWKENFAVLRDTKNKEHRAMPLVGYSMELLKEHRDTNRQLTDKLVFPHPGDRDRPWNFESVWRKVRKAAEIEDFRFHDLRHSAASYLAMNGASAAEIAEVLGHKTLQMVKRYSHLSNDHVSSVVEKMNSKIFSA